VKATLLAALPVVLYLFMVAQLSWRPRTLKPGSRVPSITHLNFSPLLAFSPDGTLLASFDDYVEVWDVRSGRLLWSRKILAAPPLAFSPDGKLLATGGEGGISLSNPYTGDLYRTFKDASSPIAFSSDSKLLCSGNGIWDIQQGKLLHKLTGQRTGMEEAVFTLDGKTIISGADDGTVSWWDAQTGTLLRSKKRPEWLGLIVFAPDASVMVTGRDFGLKVWDTQTGALLRNLTKPKEGGYDPGSFSANGKFLISTGPGPLFNSQALTSRNIQTGQLSQLRTLRCYPEFHYVLSPDGSTLATGESNGAVKLWRVK